MSSQTDAIHKVEFQLETDRYNLRPDQSFVGYVELALYFYTACPI